MLKGFRDFISRGNVVDLAVAVVVGSAFTECPECLSEIPTGARRCAHCTSPQPGLSAAGVRVTGSAAKRDPGPGGPLGDCPEQRLCPPVEPAILPVDVLASHRGVGAPAG